MNHKDLFNLLKTVKKNIRCPQCGSEYNFDQIKIRGTAEFIVFLELSCKDHMPVLATVALTPSKLEEEASKVQVDNNDVLATFEFLEKFPGGFDKLFLGKKTGK